MFLPTKYLLVACFVFLLGGCVSSSGRVVVQDGYSNKVDIAFTDHDRELLHNYYGNKYRSKYKQLPPGLAKKNKLPPGIQKQLVRNGQLPSGLNYQRLPYDLERKMSSIPDGFIRVMINSRFVLFNEHTRVIFDIVNEL